MKGADFYKKSFTPFIGGDQKNPLKSDWPAVKEEKLESTEEIDKEKENDTTTN